MFIEIFDCRKGLLVGVLHYLFCFRMTTPDSKTEHLIVIKASDLSNPDSLSEAREAAITKLSSQHTAGATVEHPLLIDALGTVVFD